MYKLFIPALKEEVNKRNEIAINTLNQMIKNYAEWMEDLILGDSFDSEIIVVSDKYNEGNDFKDKNIKVLSIDEVNTFLRSKKDFMQEIHNKFYSGTF